MDDQQKVEIYEKAIYIAKNAGIKDGIYFKLEKNSLDIFYSEWDDLLSVYWKLNPVLSARSGKFFRVIDDSYSQQWIDQINKEFRALMQKTKKGEI